MILTAGMGWAYNVWLPANEEKSTQKEQMAKVWYLKMLNPKISCLLLWYQNDYDSRNRFGLVVCGGKLMRENAHRRRKWLKSGT
jgi:hypothetical protein